MTEWPHQSLMVKPRDPFQGCQFHRFKRLPGPSTMDDLGLVQTIDGLGQGVVVAIALAAD